MPPDRPEQNEAILFFSDDQIAREMLYPEFEAILDGVVPVPEQAGTSAKGAYLRIDEQLCITAMVFFRIDFDAAGAVDQRWNVPLQQLAGTSAKGPDLGAGPINLACYSQCPIEWQQKNLWDPQMQPGRNSFVLARKAVQRNRLGLKVRAKPVSPKVEEDKSHQQLQQKLHQQYSQELRDRMAHMLREQRLRITTLNNRHERRVQALQQENQKRLQLYREKIQQLQEKNAQLNHRHETLRVNFDAQTTKLEGMREYFSHKLKAAHLDESSQLHSLQENFELELEARIQSATNELQERLDMREMELFYRQQQESNLKEEVGRLRQENQSLLNQGSGQLLGKISRAGINFVAFHPGAGQISVAVEEMGRYLDNPEAFAADKCGVDESHYRDWLEHYQDPQCRALDALGNPCAQPINRVNHPRDFHQGESDHCAKHQDLASETMAEQG